MSSTSSDKLATEYGTLLGLDINAIACNQIGQRFQTSLNTFYTRNQNTLRKADYLNNRRFELNELWRDWHTSFLDWYYQLFLGLCIVVPVTQDANSIKWWSLNNKARPIIQANSGHAGVCYQSTSINEMRKFNYTTACSNMHFPNVKLDVLSQSQKYVSSSTLTSGQLPM